MHGKKQKQRGDARKTGHRAVSTRLFMCRFEGAVDRGERPIRQALLSL